MVEKILAQNGLNVGIHMPNFISLLSKYIRQTKLPMGQKVPKFTKFTGDISESTVEHVVRYQNGAGDIVNNKNLKLKYFRNSFTKNVFAWFTTLPSYFVQTWSQLERLFHE